MADWTAGYCTDIDYTHGYYSELSPLNMQFALLLSGFLPPEVETACELGYGHGVSLNIHAAASGISWYGTDFNPTHTVYAHDLSSASGARAFCHNDSFLDFAERTDLPEFDFIALHGIWTWVSEENQKAIMKLIDRRLRVGGVVYIGYNSMPGWAPVLPLRELLFRHFETATRPGTPIPARIEEAIHFLERLFESQPAALLNNPMLTQHLGRIGKDDRRYLAHDYFVGVHWQPRSIAEMAETLEAVRLRFACSARPLDAVDAINLTLDQGRILAEVHDPVMGQMLRDFMTNRFFRRDYWTKGAKVLSSLERARRLREMRVILLRRPDDLEMKVTGSLGEADLLPEIYGPVLDALAEHIPLEIGTVEHLINDRNVPFHVMLEAITILIAKGFVMLVQPEDRAASAQGAVKALNRHILQRAECSGELSVMASTTTGGGVGVGRAQQLCLAAVREVGPDEERITDRVWSNLREQGQIMLRDGKPVEGDAENRNEVLRTARAFLDREHAMLEKLGVA